MAFFDEVGKRLNDVVSSVQKSADAAKVQRQISQKMSEFDAVYRQIGQLYYASRVRNTPPDPTIDTLCKTLTVMTEEVEALKKKADEIQNIRRCPDCGMTLDRQSRFCSHCGAKIADAAPETAKPEPENDEDGEGIPVDWPETPVTAEEAAEETACAVEESVECAAEAAEDFADQAADAVEDAADRIAEEAEDAVEDAADKAADAAEETAGDILNTFKSETK